MVRLILAAFLAFLSVEANAGSFSIFQAANGLSNTPLTVLNLGSGGNVAGQNISAQGVRFERGDTFGGYIFGTDNTWHLINGQANMCPGGVPCAYFGLNPANTSANQTYPGFAGVIELVGCPSSSSCAMMYGGGWVFYSGNISTSNPSSITWCNTGFTQTTDSPESLISGNPNDPGPFAAIDPYNANHIIVGTAKGGLFETFNANACLTSGTSTWTQISSASIPTGSQSLGYPAYLVAFDPTAGSTTCTGGNTCAKVVYVWTQGGSTTGVYTTTNGESSWSLTSSGPSTGRHIKVSAASAGGGNVWFLDGGSRVWVYGSGSTGGSQGCPTSCAWTEISTAQLPTSQSINDIAVDACNGSHVIAVHNGQPGVGNAGGAYVSTSGQNGGTATFNSFNISSIAAGDTGWAVAAYAANHSFLPVSVDFDPSNCGTIIAGANQWVWQTTFPSGNFTWMALSSGIQGPVTEWTNIAVGAYGQPTIGFQDITACTFNVSTPNTPPSGCALAGNVANLGMFSGLSVAPGTTTMFSKFSANTAQAFDLSGYSTDGFKTTFLPFNSWNTTVTGSAISNNAGAIEITLITTGLNSFVAGTSTINNSIVCAISSIFVSATFSQDCYPITVGSGNITLLGSTYNAAIANAGVTYTIYVPAPVFSDWFGFGTISNVTASGSNVQVFFPGASLTAAGEPICISGVAMTTTTTVNGCWTIQSVGGGAVVLSQSSFVGGDTFKTSGQNGIATFVMAPGGSVAASTTQNIAIYGADNTFAYCTTNAGQSWSKVSISGVPVLASQTVSGSYSAGATSVTASATGLSGSGLYIQLTSGRWLDEAGSTVVGTTITLAVAVPTGDSISNGAAIAWGNGGTVTGGPFQVALRSHQIAADPVTANTFYYMNDAVGLVKWTNCGSTSIIAAGTPGSGFLHDYDNDQLKAVPGQNGHLFFTTGGVGSSSSNHPANNLLYRTCQGSQATATMQQVTGFYEPLAVGFGPAAPGHNYASIYVAGWYSATNSQSTATFGIWRAINGDADNGDTTNTCSASLTWTNLTGGGSSIDDSNGFPAGFPGTFGIVDVEGDPFAYGLYYTTEYPFGQFYGVQNFLLNRDLNPANDNSPTFLNRAA